MLSVVLILVVVWSVLGVIGAGLRWRREYLAAQAGRYSDGFTDD